MPQLKYWTSVEKIEVGSIKKKYPLITINQAPLKDI